MKVVGIVEVEEGRGREGETMRILRGCGVARTNVRCKEEGANRGVGRKEVDNSECNRE